MQFAIDIDPNQHDAIKNLPQSCCKVSRNLAHVRLITNYASSIVYLGYLKGEKTGLSSLKSSLLVR